MKLKWRLILVNEQLSNKRNKIFISHANPNDNDFTKWLSLKLIALGYDVWCDILFLEKGVDFWKRIENEIRNNTCKFLVVLSDISNVREGVLKEITVAEKIKKELNDESFILPLLIDNKLTYDKINIQLSRLNTIDFTESWIKGLDDLNKFLSDNKVQTFSDGYSNSNETYKNIFLKDRNTIIKYEKYNSNWFPILSLPSNLYFHSIDVENITYLKEHFPYPMFEYKNYICTFSEDIDCILPNQEMFDSNRKIIIPTSSIINRSYDTDFVKNFECKNFMIRLLNHGFKKMMLDKYFQQYQLSSFKTGYWFELNQLEKNKINKVLFVGKRKEFNWHFGVSGLIKLIPFPMLILSSHIFFTTDGKKLLSSKSKQHKLRRKHGGTWYNDNWNDKLKYFAKYLVKNNEEVFIPVGTKENVIVSSKSVEFTSHLSYINTKDNMHEEEAYVSTIDYLDDYGENEHEDIDGIIL